MSTTPSKNDSPVDRNIADSRGGSLWAEGVSRANDWELPTDTAPCAVYRDGPAAMGRVTTPLGDLHVTNLFGDDISMGRQLGQRCGRHIHDGALPYLNRFIDDVAQVGSPGPLVRAAGWMLQRGLADRLRGSVDERRLKVWQGFAEATGYEPDSVVDGQLLWDLWAVLARMPLGRVRKAAAKAREHSPLLGSFSLVLPTDQAGPLHLRWLDNAAAGRWDRETTVACYHPDRGISHLLVSSAGFIAGLPCGMNAAGLTVTVEPSARRQIDWDGTVVAGQVQKVLAGAHTIEEAASILRQRPSLTPWRYVLCEGDTGRTAVLETGETVERHSGFDSPPFALGSWNARLPEQQLARVNRWEQRRRLGLKSVMNRWSGAGNDTVYDALEMLTDGGDGSAAKHDRRVSAIAALSNTAAVVFEPAARRIWVGVGRAPVSRRWFVPLSLRSQAANAAGLDTRVRPIKPAGNWESEPAGRASDHLRHARQLTEGGESPERILITIEHAVALQEHCPSFHILAGLMALRARRARRAEGAFRKALELIDDSVRSAEVRVFLAWALDAQKKRTRARQLYDRVIQNQDTEPAVRRWAQQGRSRRFNPGVMHRFTIDFFAATVFERKL